MPGAVLHLKHVDLLADDGALPDELRRAMSRHRTTARFGAILHDLPYYTSIVPMTLGYWLELAAEVVPLSARMHSDDPGGFAWHVLVSLARANSAAAQQLDREQRLALCGGFFAHIALDLELHGLVNWCARRDTLRYGGNETHHHRLAEKYHSMFFHIDSEGRDCLGRRSFFEQRAVIVPRPSLWRLPLELPLTRLGHDVLGYFGADRPSLLRVARWLRTFRRFTFLISIPAARRNTERLGHDGNRYRYYDNEDFRFIDHWERAYERSRSLLHLAYRAFAGGCFDDRARAEVLGEAAISDLAYPPARDLPALPR